MLRKISTLNNGYVNRTVENGPLEPGMLEGFEHGVIEIFKQFPALLAIIILTSGSLITKYWNAFRMAVKGNYNDLKNIPGPRAIPILGTRWIYTKIFGCYQINQIHEAYKDMFEKYGNIMKEEALWNVPVISVRNKSSIVKVLKKSGKYPLRPPNEVISFYRGSRPDRYTNLGLVNEQGETWNILRTTLTPELTSNRTMKKFLPELMTIAQDFISLVDGSRNNDNLVVSFEELSNRLGLESTCTLILGKRLGFLENGNVEPVGKLLADSIREQFCASRDTFYGLPLWKLFPTPAYNKFVKSEDTIYDIISKLVEETIIEDSETCQIDNIHKVFTSILTAPGVDMRDKKAALVDFIAAGIKTLGNTLVFLLYLIAKHPKVQQKLYEEIEEIATTKSITFESLKGAAYLRACIMEAFRILPTAPLVSRITDSTMELDGYTIPEGSVVLCHTWRACMLECNFESPDEFLPERWFDIAETDSKSHILVIPFGYGRRMCPGRRFVELELQVVLAEMIRQFDISFEGELKLEFEFLLVPAPATNFTFTPRV